MRLFFPLNQTLSPGWRLSRSSSRATPPPRLRPPPPPPLPTDVWASSLGDEEKDNEPLPSPLLVPSLPSRPPHVFRRSTAALNRHGSGSRPTPLGGVADETSCRKTPPAPKTPLSATMEDLQTRLREKLHSKLDGGSLLSPVTVAKGQEVWKELQPHLDVLRESAQLTAGSELQAVASEKLDLGLRLGGERVRESLCEDEHMPRWAQAWVHRLMDVMWPEVHREAHSSIMLELGEKLGQYDEPWKEDDQTLTLTLALTLALTLTLTLTPTLTLTVEGGRRAAGAVARLAAAILARPLAVQCLPVRPVDVAGWFIILTCRFSPSVEPGSKPGQPCTHGINLGV